MRTVVSALSSRLLYTFLIIQATLATDSSSTGPLCPQVLATTVVCHSTHPTGGMYFLSSKVLRRAPYLESLHWPGHGTAIDGDRDSVSTLSNASKSARARRHECQVSVYLLRLLFHILPDTSESAGIGHSEHYADRVRSFRRIVNEWHTVSGGYG